MMLSDPFMQLINDAPQIVDDVKQKLRIYDSRSRP